MKALLTLILSLTALHPIYSEPVQETSFTETSFIEKPFVTCELQGQLGNQLFQIAATLSIAWDHDAEPYFPDLNRNTAYGNNYNKDRLFFRLNTAPLPRPIQNTYIKPVEEWYSADRIPFAKDLFIKGHFQSWRHFDHHRAKILEVFAPSNADVNTLANKYSDLIAEENTVAVHVRTSSKSVHHALPFIGLEYYEQAFKLFPEGTLFVIFSDRVDWCKSHFSEVENNIVFIDGNDHIQDLILMSLMKHQIIANSSYSWWAAYLNQNPDKIVIAPYYWMHPSHNGAAPIENVFKDLYLPDWHVVMDNVFLPYPEDLNSIIYSKSFDNFNF